MTETYTKLKGCPILTIYPRYSLGSYDFKVMQFVSRKMRVHRCSVLRGVQSSSFMITRVAFSPVLLLPEFKHSDVRLLTVQLSAIHQNDDQEGCMMFLLSNCVRSNITIFFKSTILRPKDVVILILD